MTPKEWTGPIVFSISLSTDTATIDRAIEAEWGTLPDWPERDKARQEWVKATVTGQFVAKLGRGRSAAGSNRAVGRRRQLSTGV